MTIEQHLTTLLSKSNKNQQARFTPQHFLYNKKLINMISSSTQTFKL